MKIDEVAFRMRFLDGKGFLVLKDKELSSLFAGELEQLDV